jgi:hypothetical protein
MRRIIQCDKEGCGIACVAMLADVTYEDARRKIFGKGPVTPTKTKAMQEALRKFGVSSAKKLIRSTKTRHYTELTQDALLKVKLPKRDAPDWHWIVWDAGCKKFHDPDPDPYAKPRVVSFLTVKASKRPPKSKAAP